MSGMHPSHKTRFSFDASTWDEICVKCGATDIAGGGWGALALPCEKEHDTEERWAIKSRQETIAIDEPQPNPKEALAPQKSNYTAASKTRSELIANLRAGKAWQGDINAAADLLEQDGKP